MSLALSSHLAQLTCDLYQNAANAHVGVSSPSRPQDHTLNTKLLAGQISILTLVTILAHLAPNYTTSVPNLAPPSLPSARE